MIIHSSITLNTATPGTHSIITYFILLLTGFIFYISLGCLQRFPEAFSEKFRNNCSVNRNIPEHFFVMFCHSRTTSGFTKKNRSGILDFRNLFHNGNGKNFPIFPYVNHNPELWTLESDTLNPNQLIWISNVEIF